jgi:hypothetical protein
MERFNFDSISGLRDKNIINERISAFISRLNNDNLPLLSDLLADRGGNGGIVNREIGFSEQAKLQGMDLESILMFRIQYIRDEFGNDPVPGEYAYHKSIKFSKRLEPMAKRTLAKQRGTYEQEFLDIRKYKIDEKGCFKCPFESAVYFLINHGLHAITGIPLNSKEEVTRNAWKSHDGKTMRHIWNWRYREMTDELYRGLPVIKSKPVSK